MEEIIQYLIYFHAGFGGLALLSGLISIVAKKGSRVHKKSGLVFYYTMLLSALIAMLVSLLPNHLNLFLFSVGVLSLYFILSGKRALHFKKTNPTLTVDKCIATTMLCTGILMLVLPLILFHKFMVVIIVFAVIGILFSIRDLLAFRKPQNLKEKWVKIHLGNMIGGYISASTAFIVVNNFIPSIYGWFVPGILGGGLIAYWMRKLNQKTL